MNILLISPLLAPKRLPVVPNVGLAYIAGALLAAGHNVQVLDIEGHRYTEEKVVTILKESSFDVVGIGTIITGYKYVKWLVKQIRTCKPGIPVILGGSIATTIPDIVLNDVGVDIAVVGEGEVTVTELMDSIKNKYDLERVKGIRFKRNGEIINTGERKLIGNLDDLPFPAWHLFPLEEVYFRNTENSSFPSPIAYCVSTTRGCPYQCTYCYHPFINRKIRSKSAERVMAEIKKLIHCYQVKTVGFMDDLFIANRKKVFDICQAIQTEKLNIKWIASGRVNLVDEPLLTAMKNAGCEFLGFGIESGSPEILKNIKKQTTNEQVVNAIRLCKKAGIFAECSFMIGNVGETRETVFDTLRLIDQLGIEPTGFFFTTPYPGTELYQYAMEKGLIKDEIRLFESYGEQHDNILVNFTDMTNEELYKLRAEACKIASKNYRKSRLRKNVEQFFGFSFP